MTAPGATAAEAVSVAWLTGTAKDVLEGAFVPLWVKGEVSGFKSYPSGHWYLTLKDESAQLSCVVWRGATTRIPAKPADGNDVMSWHWSVADVSCVSSPWSPPRQSPAMTPVVGSANTVGRSTMRAREGSATGISMTSMRNSAVRVSPATLPMQPPAVPHTRQPSTRHALPATASHAAPVVSWGTQAPDASQ